jgi:hypothetical protein
MRFSRTTSRIGRALEGRLQPLELNLRCGNARVLFVQEASCSRTLLGAAGGDCTLSCGRVFRQYPRSRGSQGLHARHVQERYDPRRFSWLKRAAECGMLTKVAAAYLCKFDTYLYRGMRSDIRGATWRRRFPLGTGVMSSSSRVHDSARRGQFPSSPSSPILRHPSSTMIQTSATLSGQSCRIVGSRRMRGTHDSIEWLHRAGEFQ